MRTAQQPECQEGQREETVLDGALLDAGPSASRTVRLRALILLQQVTTTGACAGLRLEWSLTKAKECWVLFRRVTLC